MATPVDGNVEPRGPLDQVARTLIRGVMTDQFSWPPELELIPRKCQDLASVVDARELARQAADVQHDHTLCVTVVSQEYLRIGMHWLDAVRRLGLRNVLVVAGDEPTRAAVSARGVACVLADFGVDGGDDSYRSANGFTQNGLGMNSLKLPVARFLLERGYDVVMSDADAIWLKDPSPYLKDVADIAFQRSAYFPAELVRVWGFTACGGFIYWRAREATIAFLDGCLAELERVLSDQVAVNLALMEAEAVWPYLDVGGARPWSPGASLDDIRAVFVRNARHPLHGRTHKYGLDLLALPHHQFWRHELIPVERSEMVVCHPNSPKEELGKLAVFQAMGIQLDDAPAGASGEQGAP